MGGFYSEVALRNEKQKAQCILRNLEARRYGGRKEQRVPCVGGGAGATQGVPGDPRPLSDRNSCTVANGGASVPEVLAPAKLEGIFAVVVVPHVLEPAHRPAVGNDEEKAQKLSMHPPRGRHGVEVYQCVCVFITGESESRFYLIVGGFYSEVALQK